jgi:carbon-monoxide dehydrogenase small subunit
VEKKIVAFKVNGRVYEAMIAPNKTLSDVLREDLGLTGTKQACGSGECGACTVLVDGKPVLSCSTLAIAVRDKEIVTVEGLSDNGRLNPLQKAFVDHGAMQCGFCSPGMLMMATALLRENPNPSRQEVKEGLGGNICRCTGYVKIIDAVLSAAQEMAGGGDHHV